MLCGDRHDAVEKKRAAAVAFAGWISRNWFNTALLCARQISCLKSTMLSLTGRPKASALVPAPADTLQLYCVRYMPERTTWKSRWQQQLPAKLMKDRQHGRSFTTRVQWDCAFLENTQPVYPTLSFHKEIEKAAHAMPVC